MSIDPTVLKEVAHLQELSDSERAALAERLELLHYNVGDSIFKYGDAGHALYIIRSGEVEIFVKNDRGEMVVCETSEAGDVFGEVSLLCNGTRTPRVTAVSQAELFLLDR